LRGEGSKRVSYELIFGLAIVAAVLVAFAMLLTRSSQESGRRLREQEERSQNSLAQFREEVSRELGRLNSSLMTGVTNSGQMAAQAQHNIEAQLQGSRQMMQRLSEQLGAVQQAGRDLSESSQMLQTVLGGAKTRGILGEVALEKLLCDALAKDGYERQYRFASGEVVDTVVRVGDHLLPVDSKFPLEAYRRVLADGGDGPRREFVQAVRKHADSIAQKYIRPQNGTTDFALMFVPSEGVYYELLVSEDEKTGGLAEYCRARKVLPVGPNTLYAYLLAIVLGQRGMRLEENTRLLLGQLGGLQKELDTFANAFGKVGTHLRNARNNYEDAEEQLKDVQRGVERLGAISLPSGEPAVTPALNSGTRDQSY